MHYTVQRRLAASVMKCSPKRVWLDPTKADQIKEAITKQDIRGLVHNGVVQEKQERGISRGRARHRHSQQKKGRRKGHGSRKGVKTSRLPAKEQWMTKVRLQRVYLKMLRSKGLLESTGFRALYAKSKGGFFRSKRHVALYIEENNLIKKLSKNKQQ